MFYSFWVTGPSGFSALLRFGLLLLWLLPCQAGAGRACDTGPVCPATYKQDIQVLEGQKVAMELNDGLSLYDYIVSINGKLTGRQFLPRGISFGPEGLYINSVQKEHSAIYQYIDFRPKSSPSHNSSNYYYYFWVCCIFQARLQVVSFCPGPDTPSCAPPVENGYVKYITGLKAGMLEQSPGMLLPLERQELFTHGIYLTPATGLEPLANLTNQPGQKILALLDDSSGVIKVEAPVRLAPGLNVTLVGMSGYDTAASGSADTFPASGAPDISDGTFQTSGTVDDCPKVLRRTRVYFGGPLLSGLPGFRCYHNGCRFHNLKFGLLDTPAHSPYALLDASDSNGFAADMEFVTGGGALAARGDLQSIIYKNCLFHAGLDVPADRVAVVQSVCLLTCVKARCGNATSLCQPGTAGCAAEAPKNLYLFCHNDRPGPAIAAFSSLSTTAATAITTAAATTTATTEAASTAATWSVLSIQVPTPMATPTNSMPTSAISASTATLPTTLPTTLTLIAWLIASMYL